MANDNYTYQSQPLPPASIPGGDVLTTQSYGNSSTGEAVTFPTVTPSPSTGTVSGGGGGGSLGPTLDLALCDGTIIRVYGVVVPP